MMRSLLGGKYSDLVEDIFRDINLGPQRNDVQDPKTL